MAENYLEHFKNFDKFDDLVSISRMLLTLLVGRIVPGTQS
jgi:hypothetical protein